MLGSSVVLCSCYIFFHHYDCFPMKKVTRLCSTPGEQSALGKKWSLPLEKTVLFLALVSKSLDFLRVLC